MSQEERTTLLWAMWAKERADRECLTHPRNAGMVLRPESK